MTQARKCSNCGNEPSDEARWCGFCGSVPDPAVLCARCGHPRKDDRPFCEGCGLQHSSAELDDSFLEGAFRSVLEHIQRRRIGFTHFFMKWPARWLGVHQDGWAAEEFAYLAGLFLTLGILGGLIALGMPNKAASLGLFAYVVYRLFDIFSYELEIVFVDRHKDLTKSGGHLLSADRRVLCIFIHLLDFIACYAILFLAIGSLQGAKAFDGGAISTPVRALYLSVIVASFTGLSAVTPGTDVARLAVMSEVVLELVLFAILFSTIVGSMGLLTEMKPRPPRAPRIFARWRRASKSGEAAKAAQQHQAADGASRRR